MSRFVLRYSGPGAASTDLAVESVARAGGRVLDVSGMVVLVAGSSAGKTRACWEAIEPLRDADGWRLWHPRNPTRSEAMLAGLDRVQLRTVVWLNEAQRWQICFGKSIHMLDKVATYLT